MSQIYDTEVGQAKSMARFSGITLTQPQIDDYKRLRQPLNGLGDEQVLAEVLSQTQPADLLTFMMAYKHIFMAELAALEVANMVQV